MPHTDPAADDVRRAVAASRRDAPSARGSRAGALRALVALTGAFLFAGDARASEVRVVERGGRHTLEVDGEPFVARGAGLEGRDAADVRRLAAALAAAGGNAFRTWNPEQAEVALAAAGREGLRVLVGLGTGTGLGGFDYGDAAAVAAQHAAVTAFVDRHRDHPSVLGWVVANEPNLAFGPDGSPRVADPRVYDAIGAIVEHIRAGEPRHPATVAFAFTPTIVEDVRTALERVPALDIVSFQGYGALPAIPEVATEAAPDLPFMITEFGALGHWEMPATDWGREIEEPSGPKADGVVARMTPTVTDDRTGRLLGSFAFLWGRKQERTPTWYGLFVDDPEAADDDSPLERIATVDELIRIWSGRYPSNRAPRALGFVLDGQPATASVRRAPGVRTTARVMLEDADGDALGIRWALRREVERRSDGGLFERTPPALAIAGAERSTPADGEATLVFEVPEEPGEYRLFAYARDGHGGVATANFPFLVEPR